MSIPLAYALSLVVLVLAREMFFVLPGSGNVLALVLMVPLLSVPTLLTLLAHRARSGRTGRILARLAPAMLPACYAVLIAPLGYLDLAETYAGDCHLAHLVLLLLPLLVAESLRIVCEVRLVAAIEGGDDLRAMLRNRFAFVALFTLPWLLLGVLGDLLQENRSIYSFVVGTSTGLTIGTLVFVVCMGILLPLVFRLALGLSRDLPEPVGTELRATAAALGFRGRAVMFLDSGMRTVNALMIGPLPWPRYLVLTDGLIAILDVGALRGVVAHEVGHAQAGHPALLLLLFVAAPLLTTNLLQQLPIDQLSTTWTIAVGVAVVLLGWWLLRKVSHRFEHEADVLSAIALGGAEPCINALSRVGEVVHGEPQYATTLHPSETARVALLRRFAEDPLFRARFALRGLHLRRGIAAVVLLALLAGAFSWYRSWPHELAAHRFYNGDLEGAQAQVELVGVDVPAGQWTWWERFRQDLDAAQAIAGDGGDWEQLRPRFASEGWRRGVEVLVQQGPAAARPWMALATEDAERSPLRRCVLLFCEAAVDADLERMEALAAQVRALGVPAELAAVFAR